MATPLVASDGTPVACAIGTGWPRPSFLDTAFAWASWPGRYTTSVFEMPLALLVLPTVQPAARRTAAFEAAAPLPPNPFSTSTLTVFHATVPCLALPFPPPPPPPPPPLLPLLSGAVVTGVVVAGVVEWLEPTLESAHRNASSASASHTTARIRAGDGAPSREGIPCDSNRRANQSSRCSSPVFSSASIGRLRVSTRAMYRKTIPLTCLGGVGRCQ